MAHCTKHENKYINSLPPHLIDPSTPTPPSNPISKLACSVLQAFMAPNNTIHALPIHICLLILAPTLLYKHKMETFNGRQSHC